MFRLGLRTGHKMKRHLERKRPLFAGKLAGWGYLSTPGWIGQSSMENLPASNTLRNCLRLCILLVTYQALGIWVLALWIWFKVTARWILLPGGTRISLCTVFWAVVFIATTPDALTEVVAGISAKPIEQI
jgi:hypothetical protein